MCVVQVNMFAVQVRVQYKNVCYISNLARPKTHNIIHVNNYYYYYYNNFSYKYRAQMIGRISCLTLWSSICELSCWPKKVEEQYYYDHLSFRLAGRLRIRRRQAKHQCNRANHKIIGLLILLIPYAASLHLILELYRNVFKLELNDEVGLLPLRHSIACIQWITLFGCIVQQPTYPKGVMQSGMVLHMSIMTCTHIGEGEEAYSLLHLLHYTS